MLDLKKKIITKFTVVAVVISGLTLRVSLLMSTSTRLDPLILALKSLAFRYLERGLNFLQHFVGSQQFHV